MKKVSLIFFLLCVFSCKKNSQPQANNPVPSVPVSVMFYPNDASYFKLQTIGGWMYIDGGINGLVVYRKSQEEFVALERTSSYLPNNPAAKVKVMNDNFILRDTISDSRWRIFDGVVTKGPATWALRLYRTSYDGNVLKILN